MSIPSWAKRPSVLVAAMYSLSFYLLISKVQSFSFPHGDHKGQHDLLRLYNEPIVETWDNDQPNDRRAFLQSIAMTTAIATGSLVATPEAANAVKERKRFSVVVGKNGSTSASAIRQPVRDSVLFTAGLGTESCLLRLLPVENTVFRTIEDDLKFLKLADSEAPTEKNFRDIVQKTASTCKYLDSQRTKLEPLFNQEDPTALSIAKAERGERLIENLRTEIDNINSAAMGRKGTVGFQAQKRALRILSEIGELLVNSFPYDIPTDGKFSFLPRLLGRAKVTFTISRVESGKDQVLGNVTMLADGFAAPITAGNFVDLSARGFYNGLSVKMLKKRFGVNPTLTMAEPDNVVAYDIANTVDQLTGEGGIIQKTFDNLKSKKGEKVDDAEEGDIPIDGTLTTSIPVFGSFNEGFYDPLTAKPRRLPLEIVQFDRLTGTASLAYESSFSTLMSKSKKSNVFKSNSLLVPPLLTFDIPGLVAMNHPDKNLNGGSSEFFCLTENDLFPNKAKLLDGTYAPFGYVLDGLELLQNVQPGDTISSTAVNDFGQLNLQKIRGTSFADAMSGADQDNPMDV